MKSQTKKILKLSGIIQKAVAVVNPMDYLRQQKISIHRLALEHADIYAYKNKDGIANWDITVPDTVQSASSPAGDAMNISELDIRQISIKHATVTMDDRDTRIFANLWDTNLTLKANMKKGHSMLAVDFRNKNLLFWQDGQLLANRIATHLRTDLELNTARHSLLLHDAMIDINGTKLGVKEPCAATPQPKRSTSICNTGCTPPRWKPYCT